MVDVDSGAPLRSQPGPSSGPLPGSRLLVVGGCGGIGRALTRAALGRELRVAVFDLKEAAAASPPPPGALLRCCDATSESQLREALESLKSEWQGLDCLVNLAGAITESAPLDESDPEEWARTLDSSLRSTYLACREALPWLRRGSSPSIVNMSSGMAYVGRRGYSAYAAAKAGILAITRTLAAENAPWLRVNAVAPGAVDTPFLSGGTGTGGDSGAGPTRFSLEAYLKLVPLGRLATPEEVAQPILFLAGDGARYITGQVLHINGGALMA